jgi:hypothetical protein
MDDRVPRKKEGLLEKVLEDEIVVLSHEGDVLHSFGGTARLIWSMIDGANSLEAIAGALTDEYLVEATDARSDLEAFIAELENLSLICLGQDHRQ